MLSQQYAHPSIAAPCLNKPKYSQLLEAKKLHKHINLLGHGKQKMSADLVQSLSGDASLQGFISHLWTSQS